MENQKQQQINRLKQAILTDPARIRRLGIKDAEERVAKESRSRRLNAPKSIEEKILFSR